MKLSGHTSVRSLARYVRVSDEGLRRSQLYHCLRAGQSYDPLKAFGRPLAQPPEPAAA